MVNETTGTNLFERIQRRKAERESRFITYKLICNPFTPYKPENAVRSLADRDDQKDKFASSFLKLIEGEIKHIFIVGKRGLGKSHILRYFFEEIRAKKEELGIGEPLYFNDPAEMHKWLSEQNKTKDIENVKYVFLDDAYFLSMMHFLPITNPNALFKNKFIRIICSWQESIIADMPKLEPSGVTEDFDEIRLPLFKEEDEAEILRKRIIVSCDEKDEDYCLSLFDKSFFTELTKISHGNPRLLLRYASDVFTDGWQIEKKSFNGKDVIAYVLKHGIRSTKQIQETFERLNQSQRKVLYAISAITHHEHENECELKKISSALDVSRPWAIQSLIPLQEAQIVEVRKEGAKNLYKISENYRDFFEERYKDEIKSFTLSLSSLSKEED